MEAGEAPLLVYTHGNSKRRQFQTFCTMSPLPPNNSSYRRSMPQLRGKAILSSSHGWLILENKSDVTQFSLFNPMTSQLLPLPPLPNAMAGKDVDLCTLTSPPDDNKTSCVLYLQFSRSCTHLLFSIKPTRPSCCWLEQRIELDGKAVGEDYDYLLIQLVSGDGTFLYAWCQDPDGYPLFATAQIAIDDDDSDVFSLTSLPLHRIYIHLNYEKFEQHFIESCGSLYFAIVCIGHLEDLRIITVKVFELNSQRTEWVEVQDLDGRSFFLSQGSETWCWGDNIDESSKRSGVRENCLYFFYRSRDDYETLYEYNLHDQSLTTLSPCDSYLVSPYDRPVWVMPQTQSRLLRGQKLKDSRIRKADVSALDSQQLLQNDATKEGKFTQLPSDLIQFISKYLHWFDYWNFRYSCKTFLSATSSRPLLNTDKFTVPLLLSFKNDSGLCELKDPCRLDSSPGSLQLSRGLFRVVYCNNGWLLSLVDRFSIHLCNPFIREVCKIPVTEYCCSQIKGIGFSTYPTCPSCLTAGILDCERSPVIAYLHQSPKGYRWNLYVGVTHQNSTFLPSTSPPVFCKGAFYFLDTQGKLGVFRFEEGEPSWDTYDKPRIKAGKKLHSYYLVECSGNVYSVFILGNNGDCVQVFMFDNGDAKKWIGVSNLGGHSFFVSPTSSRSISHNNLRDRIYLPILKGNGIVFYSMETRKYHALGYEGSIDDLCFTRVPKDCTWI